MFVICRVHSRRTPRQRPRVLPRQCHLSYSLCYKVNRKIKKILIEHVICVLWLVQLHVFRRYTYRQYDQYTTFSNATYTSKMDVNIYSIHKFLAHGSESLTGFELFLTGIRRLWVGRSNRYATHIDSLYKYPKLYRTKREGSFTCLFRNSTN